MKKIRILQGDCIESLKKLEDESINTCITSPPYWGLRDYGTAEWVGGNENCDHVANPNATKKMGNDEFNKNRPSRENTKTKGYYYEKKCPKCGAIRKDNQLGMEETPEEFVENLVKVFREVKRVLRDDGTVWLNLGDSYSSGGRTTTTNQSLRGDKDYGVTKPKPSKGIKPKDLIGIPWRVAFALQQDGWYLRQDIIWNKPNPMPESVKDRCTKAHEYIFLLSKSPMYYFDNEAIKEGLAEASNIRLTQKNINNQVGSDRVPGKSNGPMKPVVAKKHGKYQTEENEAKHRQGIHANRGDNLVEVRNKLPSQKDFVKFLRAKTKPKILAENTDIPLTRIEHWFRADKSGFAYPSIEDWNKVKEFVDDWSKEFHKIDIGLSSYELKTDEVLVSSKRNKRSVWTVTTKPFTGAHFATFPMDLIEPCVLAGCPEKVCVKCGEPYQREVELGDYDLEHQKLSGGDTEGKYFGASTKDYAQNKAQDASETKKRILESMRHRKDLGVAKQCDCETDETRPGVVLDPFAGSGTTAVVASGHNRDAVLLELNEEYIALAKKRIRGDGDMFVKVYEN
jgi:DNA modification methylase